MWQLSSFYCRVESSDYLCVAIEQSSSRGLFAREFFISGPAVKGWLVEDYKPERFFVGEDKDLRAFFCLS
jgi:hypothetical protein